LRAAAGGEIVQQTERRNSAGIVGRTTAPKEVLVFDNRAVCLLAILVLDASACSKSPDCTSSIDTYCSHGQAPPDCVANWSQLQNGVRKSCDDVLSFAGGNGLFLSCTPCDGYDVALVGRLDIWTYYYYDVTTGKLVAAVNFDANGGTKICSGGPSTFHEPTLGGSPSSACADAGGMD
jgi:hypothetical protein